MVLAAMVWSEIPNAHIGDVVAAWARQRAHDDAELLIGMVHLARSTPLDELGDAEVGRAGTSYAWGSSEIAALLTLTPTAADRELGLAEHLHDHLPVVLAAFRAGRIDRSKAWMFCEYLDPAELSAAQIAVVCERLVPGASGWTTRQLANRLWRAILAIDPAYQRRKCRGAVEKRGVSCHLDPITGTATVSARGLPPDEAAAACARLDRLAETARRKGCAGTLGQISADLYLGMLDGRFHGLAETQIIDALIGDTELVREGVEVHIGLPTLMGRDEWPGEIAGVGPVSADVARAAVARQYRGGSWEFAIVDETGQLLHGGFLRSRPKTGGDQNCIGPGCARTARRSDLDHTLDRGKGGDTVEENAGPACYRHHPDKDRGWALSQPVPGRFVWTSPLGRVYTTRGEPIRHDLPEPQPAEHDEGGRRHPPSGSTHPLAAGRPAAAATARPDRDRHRAAAVLVRPARTHSAHRWCTVAAQEPR
ncbi:DUF222 domain-containing protein [Pseudonocardia sp. GCM10023141]|uniref:DUF222 domain-containing protein n=1 Tax=Pseudonocardia sp. GCM10023141 TaxID=3252653 RepID=UPI003621CE18